MSITSRILCRFRPETPERTTTEQDWHAAQNYELEHAIGFMQEPHFQDVFAKFLSGETHTSTGHINALFLQEFFNNDVQLYHEFISYIQGKACLDVGPCVFSPLANWDGIREGYAIEPLGNHIRDWQRKNLGRSVFDKMTLLSVPADVFQPGLVGKIDGALHCRNMLDHTPHWAFVLSNMSAYAAPGCRLLFWTDIDHRGAADEGHFDIYPDSAALERLVDQLGFSIQRTFSDSNRPELNWGCFAVRR